MLNIIFMEMLYFIYGAKLIYSCYIRVIPQGTIENHLGPDRLAGGTIFNVFCYDAVLAEN